MSCNSFKQLIDTTTGLLGVSRRKLAEFVGIGRDTIRNWEDGNRWHPSTFNAFKTFMEDPYERLGDSRDGYNVSKELCDVVATHYRDWWRHHNADLSGIGDSDDVAEISSGVIHAHVEATEVLLTMIRWRDRSNPSNCPFETKNVNGVGVEVFDEAVVNRVDKISSTDKANIRLDALSSGAVAIEGSEPDHTLVVETYINSTNRTAPLVFTVSQGRSTVSYKARVFNGFQRDFERVDAKQLTDWSTGKIRLEVDFGDTIPEEGFTQSPVAQYILIDGAREDIEITNPAGSTRWIAEHKDPAPNARLRLSWSFLPKA